MDRWESAIKAVTEILGAVPIPADPVFAERFAQRQLSGKRRPTAIRRHKVARGLHDAALVKGLPYRNVSRETGS